MSNYLRTLYRKAQRKNTRGRGEIKLTVGAPPLTVEINLTQNQMKKFLAWLKKAWPVVRDVVVVLLGLSEGQTLL